MVAADQPRPTDPREGGGCGRGEDCAVEIDAVVARDVAAVEAAANPRKGDRIGCDAAGDVDAPLIIANAERAGGNED